ncbi:MAG: 6-phosphofructokinase [Alphaproteobacteria bacterium]|nr:6-phosphofructokinase [Alphaproteobacteria bacterium]MCB9699637.1 6-phosphofructokinase [Alphaproteobacteria bacterium]
MRIGVLTSGGDAPGMNGCVRSVVKGAVGQGHTAIGIRRGYEGLLAGDASELSLDAVDGLSRYGGTRLGSARCKAMMTPAGLQRALDRIGEMALDALIVIGGNGSLTGAHALAPHTPARIVGVPASIDNDVGHSALAIGVDTAVNTIVDAADRISDTATAHHRVFVIEVMGRHCGFLAMRSGVAADADAILVPERKLTREQVIERCVAVLRASFRAGRHKERVLIVKAEGVEVPTAELVAELRGVVDAEMTGVDVRETVLGHIVRGGAPSALDRLIAARLGLAAVDAACRGLTDVMVGWEPPRGAGEPTRDPSVRTVRLAEVLVETERMLSADSELARARLALLDMADGLLAL